MIEDQAVTLLEKHKDQLARYLNKFELETVVLLVKYIDKYPTQRITFFPDLVHLLFLITRELDDEDGISVIDMFITDLEEHCQP